MFAHNTGRNQRVRRVRPGDAGADLSPHDRPAGPQQRPGDRPPLGHARTTSSTALARSVEPERAEFEKLLADIQRQRDEADTARRAEETARREAEQIRERLETRMEEIDSQRAEMATQARREVEREVEEARESLRRAARRISDAQAADSEAARRDAEEAAERVESLRRREEPRVSRKKAAPPPPAPIRPRSRPVTWSTSTASSAREGPAPVDERGELAVSLGNLRTKVKVGQVVRVEKPSRGAERAVTIQMRPAPADITSEVHLRGERVEQALPKLEEFLDNAYRAGYPTVRVIHGKGTGTMRQVVQETLRGHPLVRGYETAPPNEGGEGVTLAHLAVEQAPVDRPAADGAGPLQLAANTSVADCAATPPGSTPGRGG